MRRGFAVLISLVGMVWLLAAVGSAAPAPPSNDIFANAQELTGSLPIDVTGTTVEATREIGEPVAPDAIASGHSVWYRWEAPSTSYVSVGACGTDVKVNLAVYTGSAVGALNEVDSSRYRTAEGCGWNFGRVSFLARAGVVYSIAAEGSGLANQAIPPGTGEEPIELILTHPTPPANDDFADAEGIETREIDYPFLNLGATREPGEPNHGGEAGGASVWFRWTAPFTGGAFAQACPRERGRESVLAAYTGTTLGTLVPVAKIMHYGKCGAYFFATAGVTYSIAVDGVIDPGSGLPEIFESAISVRRIPLNDDFENAQPLQTPSTGPFTNVMWGGPNIGATKQPGEPDHAGNPGGHSVWFDWTAPFSGSVQVSICDTDFPTALGIYTGSSVAALTPVASDTSSSTASCPLEGHGFGDIGFNTVVGTTYHLAFDGIDGALGNFHFSLWASNEPAKPRPTPGLTSSAPPPPAPPKPKATIAGRHIDQRRHLAVFDLHSTQSGARFRCKLDESKFARCGAKVVYRHLAEGRHVFRAQAVGSGGVKSAPVKASFAIRR